MRFSDDDVVDFLVTEALTYKAFEEQKSAEKDHEEKEKLKQFHSKESFDNLRLRAGS